MSDVAVVDLGTGNLRSVRNALEYVAPRRCVDVTSEPDLINRAHHVVLPGQGAIGTWMIALSDQNLKDSIDNALQNKPVLGICLGLQALFAHSEEDGGVTGLNRLKGEVKRFPSRSGLKIPHMGWNNVTQTQPHPLWHNIEDNSRFYFVHSYYVQSNNNEQIAGHCEYGLQFVAAAMKKNLFAVQFHPEKSQQAGLGLLKNFLAWDGSV